MVKKCGKFCLALLLLLIFVDFSVSVGSPASSPSLPPVSGADSPSSPISAPPVSGADSPSSPISAPPVSGADSPSLSLISFPPATNSDAPAPVEGPEVSSSPQAPPSGSPTPASSPSESPLNSPERSPVPSPAPSEASDISHSDITSNGDDTDGSDGMSGGKKAGIAVGVIAAACVVGFGGIVFKKRRENVRRSQYSYSARHDLL